MLNLPGGFFMPSADVLMCVAVVGLIILVVQRIALEGFFRRPMTRPTRFPGISILKPLCGLDDALEENLAYFARLPYPTYEVLLGLRDERDPAYALAIATAKRWPAVFRVVLQRGELGFNPKVNQLVTLEKEAAYGLLLISDSNARPASPRYLTELVAHFEDPRVACVANPVSGLGHQSIGAMLDNLHLSAFLGAGQIASKVTAGKDLVIGKSMAIRREALAELGGFAAYADCLAEDHVIGLDISRTLGRKVAFAQTIVHNVAVHRSVQSFFDRYRRWAIIQRTAVSLPMHIVQALMNPVPLAVLGFMMTPSLSALAGIAVVFAARLALDLSTARRLQCGPFDWRVVPAMVVKDALLFAAWAEAIFGREVVWRGTKLRVTHGSRLVPIRPALRDGFGAKARSVAP